MFLPGDPLSEDLVVVIGGVDGVDKRPKPRCHVVQHLFVVHNDLGVVGVGYWFRMVRSICSTEILNAGSCFMRRSVTR